MKKVWRAIKTILCITAFFAVCWFCLDYFGYIDQIKDSLGMKDKAVAEMNDGTTEAEKVKCTVTRTMADGVGALPNRADPGDAYVLIIDNKKKLHS